MRNDRDGTDGIEELRVPIVREELRVEKRRVETARVQVRTGVAEEAVMVRDTVERRHVEVIRVPVDREVSSIPAVREEGDLTIIPVVEERLVVEKRLFLVEEVHLRRFGDAEAVAIPVTLRRTTIEVERQLLGEQGEH